MTQEATEIVTLTEPVLIQLRQLIEKQGDPDLALRVYVSPGGCSGIQYGMALDSAVLEDDEVFEQGGLKVVVDELSLGYLRGARIDYVDGPTGAGFAVYNPNALRSCSGCRPSDAGDDGGKACCCE